MDLTQELITMLVDEVNGTRQVQYLDQLLDFDKWQRLTMREAVIRFWPQSETRPTVDQLTELPELQRLAEVLKVAYDSRLNEGQLLGLLFETVAEPQLINPTFITEFPTQLSPLSKQKPGDPRFVERFELYISVHGDRQRILRVE